MSRHVRWTRRALSRLDHIGAYIAQHDAAAARRVIGRIRSATDNLSLHPSMGRPGRIADTRELVLTDIPYIIAYRLTQADVEILTIMHTSQRWPKRF